VASGEGGFVGTLGKRWSGGGDSFSKTKMILAECDEWQVTTCASAFPTASPLSFSFSA